MPIHITSLDVKALTTASLHPVVKCSIPLIRSFLFPYQKCAVDPDSCTVEFMGTFTRDVPTGNAAEVKEIAITRCSRIEVKGASHSTWAIGIWVPLGRNLFIKRETRLFEVHMSITLNGQTVVNEAQISVSYLPRIKYMP